MAGDRDGLRLAQGIAGRNAMVRMLQNHHGGDIIILFRKFPQ